MMDTIRAESRKLMSVRSTYWLLGFATLIVIFVAGYLTGYKITPIQLHTATYLSSQISDSVTVVATLASIAILLLMAHEYRHNTIIYTLTLSRGRSKVLLAKIVVASVFMAIFTLFVAVISPLVTLLGIHLHGLNIVHQTITYGDLLWRILFYTWGYGMFALMLIALIRNQIGAIVVLLFVPATVEQLLSLLLKDNSKYLPFTALKNVILPSLHSASPGTSALIVLAYLIVGWLITWQLFLRRDAN